MAGMPHLIRRVPQRYERAFREENGARGPFEAEMRWQGREPAVSTSAARTLDGDLVRERVMYADGNPVQLATTIIPAEIAAKVALDESATGTGGLMSRLADAGHAPVRFTETITPFRPPTMREGELIPGIGPGEDGSYEPVTEIRHEAFDAGGNLVETTVTVLPRPIWTLEYSWHQADPGTPADFRRSFESFYATMQRAWANRLLPPPGEPESADDA